MDTLVKRKRRQKGERGIRHVKINGRWVWQARVAHGGARRSRLCDTFEEARQAKAELIAELQKAAAREAAEASAPATLRQLLELYALDMEARGKGAESVERVEYTARAIRETVPELLDKAVSAIRDADVFAFRNARARAGTVVDGKKTSKRAPTKPSTINRDLRTLRAALKRGRPDYRFPGGAFFPEDETRAQITKRKESRRPRAQAVGLDTPAVICDDGGAESRPRGDSARGLGVCQTPGPHPSTPSAGIVYLSSRHPASRLVQIPAVSDVRRQGRPGPRRAGARPCASSRSETSS